jgi:hypothetical protein
LVPEGLMLAFALIFLLLGAGAGLLWTPIRHTLARRKPHRQRRVIPNSRLPFAILADPACGQN